MRRVTKNFTPQLRASVQWQWTGLSAVGRCKSAQPGSKARVMVLPTSAEDAVRDLKVRFGEHSAMLVHSELMAAGRDCGRSMCLAQHAVAHMPACQMTHAF